MDKTDIFELNDKNWEQIVEKGDKPVFIMFYSQTCPYCKQMEPYFDQYSNEFNKKVIFCKLNVTENPTIVGRYGIMGTPTFKYFCKGKPIQEMSGVVYPSLIKKTIEEGIQHGENCLNNTSWFDPSYA